MTSWTETYRGVVSAWECDVVEHFTIAYYFDRFADAARNLLELSELGEALTSRVGAGPSRIVATFQHELRAGAAFHMTSAVIGTAGQSLSLGHQVIDTASGKPVTWVYETIALPDLLPAAVRDKLTALATAWPGPEIPAPSARLQTQGALTARDRVKPWEIDERERLALPDFVHRFSGAGMHFLTSVGMTGEYMQKNRRGFSTFLLDVEIASEAKAGERLDVRTAPAHLGNTSLKYVHTMTGADGRRVASMVQAGVQLDLDARRPTAFPADIRAAIQSQLAG